MNEVVNNYCMNISRLADQISNEIESSSSSSCDSVDKIANIQKLVKEMGADMRNTQGLISEGVGFDGKEIKQVFTRVNKVLAQVNQFIAAKTDGPDVQRLTLEQKQIAETVKSILDTVKNEKKTVTVFSKNVYIAALGSLSRGEEAEARKILEEMNNRCQWLGLSVDVNASIDKMKVALAKLEGASPRELSPRAFHSEPIVERSPRRSPGVSPRAADISQRLTVVASTQAQGAPVSPATPRDEMAPVYAKPDSEIIDKNDLVNLHMRDDAWIFQNAIEIRADGDQPIQISYSRVPVGGGGPDILLKSEMPLNQMINADVRIKLMESTLEKYLGRCPFVEMPNTSIDGNLTPKDVVCDVARMLSELDVNGSEKEYVLERICLQFTRILMGSYQPRSREGSEQALNQSIEGSLVDALDGAEEVSLNDQYLLEFTGEKKITGAHYFNHGTIGGLLNTFFSSVQVKAPEKGLQHIIQELKPGEPLARGRRLVDLVDTKEGAHEIVGYGAVSLDIYIKQGAADCRGTNCMLGCLLDAGYKALGSGLEARILYAKVQDGKGGAEFNKARPEDHNLVLVGDSSKHGNAIRVMDAYFPRYNNMPLDALVAGVQNGQWFVQVTGATKYPREQMKSVQNP